MKRNEIEDRYKWNLKLVLQSDSEFFDGITSLKNYMRAFSDFRGKLGDAGSLLEFLTFEERASRLFDRLYLYAFLKKSANGADASALEMYGLASDLGFAMSEATAFASVELAALDEKTLKSLESDPRFANFDVLLKKIRKNKPHILSEKEEVILSGIGRFADFDSTFDAMSNIELKFKSVKLPSGERVKLTTASYSSLVKHSDRSVRKQAFENLHKGFSKFNLTLSQNFINQMKYSNFSARTSKFKSAFERALFYEEIDRNIYKNLIDSVHSNLQLFYEYTREKARILGHEKLGIFDMFSPSVAGVEYTKTFEESFDIVKSALACLGEDYTNNLERMRSERWIDVFPSEGKDSGAFSVSCSTGNPFVLLNYTPCFDEISTMAHELGHAMHSFYSDKNQPYPKRDYTIFVAEVASTVNELLLDRYILGTTSDSNLKNYIVDSILQKFYSTVFRQTMFSEFEFKTHSLVVAEKPVSYENLGKIYSSLQKKYFGLTVERGRLAKYEWSRIPHFYRPFYVYKYATGLICATIISQKLFDREPGFAEKYKSFLSSGCKTDPVSLLKLAEVDITKKETFDTAFAFYSDMLDRYKKIK